MRYSVHVETWPESVEKEIEEACRIFCLAHPKLETIRDFQFEQDGMRYDNKAVLCDLSNGDEMMVFRASIRPGDYLMMPPRRVAE